MSDNKKYYYLKLKENFFDSEEMIILQNMQDGYLYSDILMKLYLRSLKTDGRLMFKNIIPYTPPVLAQVVRHQVGTVEKALNIFKELGLIEILDNGAIYMLDIQNFIGESSTEADRIRKYRAKIKNDKENVQMLHQTYDKSTPEIEKEIEIEKETKIKKEQSVSKITKCYEDNIGMITPAVAERLFAYINDFDDYNLIIKAIKISALNNKRSANYICGILESWKRKGYKVIADIQNEQRKKTKEETEDEKIARQVKELEEAIKKDELTGIYTSNSKS